MSKITVILGAGASAGCVENKINSFNANYMPPVVNELFDIRGETFSVILTKYPGAMALTDEIRVRLAGKHRNPPEKESLEDILSSFNHSPDPIKIKNYRHIPLYLQELLGEVSAHFANNQATKFDTLVSTLLSKPDREILFITTNYDTLLEQAITRVTSHSFDSIESYMPSESRWKLLKIHGSINWGKCLLNPINLSVNPIRGISMASLIINQIPPEDELKLSSKIEMLKGHQDGYRLIENKFYYPALAVPAGKDKLAVCDDTHLSTAEDFIKECNNFLVIGFSAMDKDVLELVDKCKKDESIKLYIVNDKKQWGNLALENIRNGCTEMLRNRSFYPDNHVANKNFADYINAGSLLGWP